MTTHEGKSTGLKHTPLYEQHRALGARLIDFGGWEMPVQYSSIIEEHQAVRTRAGLFDVSHMGEFKIEGAQAQAFLNYLVPNDVTRLAVNQALYTQLCRPDGTTVDDLLIYHLAEQEYLLVVNASNIEKDLIWIKAQAALHFPDVNVINQSDTTALIALQGPLAQQILQPLTEINLGELRYYHCLSGDVAGVTCLISRTGYTGEDGFELYCAPVDASALWTELLTAGQPHGLLPAGLGARDTLRLEAGYCLYGHELDDKTNPLQARLGWTVKFKSGNFVGRNALLKIKNEGPQRLLVGIELLERGVPRSGYTLYENNEQIGILTSGAPSPTLKKNIGMGYVSADKATIGRQIQVEIRGKYVAAQIVALPFYKRSAQA